MALSLLLAPSARVRITCASVATMETEVPRQMTAVRLAPDLLSRIDEKAGREGMSRSDLIRAALTEYLGAAAR